MRGYMIMRKLIGVLAVSVMAATVLASPADAGPPDKDTVDVIEFSGAVVTEDGATLVRTDSGVSMRLSTTVGGELFDLFDGPLGVDWEVGDATTNWFVVFNNPGACSDGVCGENDVQEAAMGFDNGSMVGVHFATGHIAGSSNWRSAASLSVGDDTGTGFGYPLLNAREAEIHVIVRSHGSMATLVGGNVAAAIGSLMGGCDINTCGDAQAAEFRI
jgi:hypothetical protein